jgi:hypothetical protein
MRWIDGLSWFLLILALGFLTIIETYNLLATIGLGLMALFFALRVLDNSLWPTQSRLEIPAILFVGSAALATFISYSQGGALLQFARILGGLGLFTMLAQVGSGNYSEGFKSRQNHSRSEFFLPRWLAAGFVIAATVLAVYWTLQNDFSSQTAKVAIFHQVGLWIEDNLPRIHFSQLTGDSIHPNVAASVFLLALGFAVSLAYDAWQIKQPAIVLFSILSALLLLGVLLLTGSRAAWIGLVAQFSFLALALIQARWFPPPKPKRYFWISVIVASLFGFAILSMTTNLADLVGKVPDPTGSFSSRAYLWQQGWNMVKDTPYLGNGLASFWMVHATYTVLIHTPFIAHSHNLFLQVWYEQGFLGALSFLWAAIIVATWAWYAFDHQILGISRKMSVWGWAGLLGLVGATVQNLVDVTFYVERTLPLVGFTLGYAYLSTSRLRRRRSKSREDQSNSYVEASESTPRNNSETVANDFIRLSVIPPVVRYLPLGVGIAIILLMILVALPRRNALISAWYANLGAIKQSKLELSTYNPSNFSDMGMDVVRQSIDLSAAETDFMKALEWQPNNRTALQRLGGIALSRGEYEAALSWLQSAWDQGHRDEVTRLLYGDALVANGQPDKAAQVVQGLGWAEGRLMFQAYYRYTTRHDFRRASDAWRAVQMINPYNRDAQRNINEAEKRLQSTP